MLTALCADWDRHGAKAIRDLRESNLVEYIKVVVAVLPKQVAIDATSQNVVYHISDQELTPEQWAAKWSGDVIDAKPTTAIADRRN